MGIEGMEAWVALALAASSYLLEAAAALIVVLGGGDVLRNVFALRSAERRGGVALVRWLWRGGPTGVKTGARDSFTRALLLALDFTIGGDLLRLAAAPEIDAVFVVAAVALVRIALTLTLEYEQRGARARDA